MTTKICTMCGNTLELLNFSKRSLAKDKLNSWCKVCCRLYNKKYRDHNTTSIANQKEIWRNNNLDHARLTNEEARRRRMEDHDYVNSERKRQSEYRANNKGKVNADTAKRRATKLQATPGFANFDKIKDLYKQAEKLAKSTGIKHHVDHIVPLRSKLVCGLHWEENLQILTKEDNLKKSNKFWPNMP